MPSCFKKIHLYLRCLNWYGIQGINDDVKLVYEHIPGTDKEIPFSAADVIVRGSKITNVGKNRI